MDAQAKVSDRGAGNGSSVNGEGVVGSIAGLGNDVATLAELQLKLATLDFKETTGRALIPLALVVLGLVGLVSSVPLALAGIALLAAELLAISLGWAFLLTAVATMLGTGLIVLFAGRRLGASFEGFRRSRDELIRNVSWIRTVLVQSGRPVPKRRF